MLDHLAGIALGLRVYHVVEPEIKDECDAAFMTSNVE